MMLVILRSLSFAPVSIPDIYGQEETVETSVTLLPQILIKQLERKYIFENPKEINNFLLKNNVLLEVLFEARDNIYRIFGQVPARVELHVDPEENWDELFIVIRSSFSVEEALFLENRFMEEWFLDRMKDTGGKLNLVVEPA
jgi:hypothetical protein